jgi:ubiquinone/menaquinone biosynthesis C-methylase UbiE
MKEVADNSMDVVVSTLVLCSVKNVKQTLKEVQRVLAPVSFILFFYVSCSNYLTFSPRQGGKFYYWEHVHDVPGTWLHFLQNLLTYTIWDLCFGCHLNRNIDHVVEENKTLFSHIDQERFDIPLMNGSFAWKLVRVHVMGVATK